MGFKFKLILIIIMVQSLLSFVQANDCNDIATKIIKAKPNHAAIKNLDAVANGLLSEVGQNPKVLFVNLAASGLGFDLAQLQVVKAFVENTPGAEIIIPSSRKDFLFLGMSDETKKATIDFMVQEEKAKRLKINFIFSKNEYAADLVNWTRDYAPVKIFNKKTKTFELIAFKYYKASPVDESLYKIGVRFMDEIQDKIAGVLKLKLKRSDLLMEGGNMLSDGNGTVYFSTKILENNPGKTKAQIESELSNLGLADKFVWLTALPGSIEPTGHVDLVMRFIAPNKVVVPSSKDAKTQRALNKIVKELEATGLSVERLEMSSNVIVTITDKKTIESHLNALPFGSSILIPKYGTDYDEEAKLYYQGLGFNVIFVTGETMKQSGSVHCMTFTY